MEEKNQLLNCIGNPEGKCVFNEEIQPAQKKCCATTYTISVLKARIEFVHLVVV